MPTYELRYGTGVEKALTHFPHDVQRRLLNRLGMLRTTPRPPGCIKLTDSDAYRIRVGDYRIIYLIHDDQLIVLVIDVGDRKNVYRRR